MKPRVVLDSNVVISGLLFKGPPRIIIDKALTGEINLFTSTRLVEEVSGVLNLKFKFATQAIRATIEAIKDLAYLMEPEEAIRQIIADPDDDRVLECAVQAKAHAIVSGDKHLLSLKQFRNILILSPAEFLEWLCER